MIDKLFLFAALFPIETALIVLVGSVIASVISIRDQFWGVLVCILISVIQYNAVAYIGGGFLDYIGSVFIPSMFFLILFNCILGLSKNDKKPDKKVNTDSLMCVEFRTSDNKKVYIPDVNRGVSIFGSSGAGKSAGPFYQLFQHFAKHKFAGVINDYKDFELTKVAYPLFEGHIDFHVFSIHDPNRSIRVNVLDEQYCPTLAELRGVVKTFVLNLNQSASDSGAEQFFRKVAESLLTAIALRLRKSYPEYCNLPFIVAFLLNTETHHEVEKQPNGTYLTKPYQKLVKFICEDREAEMIAAPFIGGLSNERQSASAFSTLASVLSELASKEIFYLLGATEVDLAINKEGSRAVISFVNKPGPLKEVISPINAMLIESVFGAISEHGRKPTFIALDEAPTIKMMNLSERIATLRSYGVCFIYGLQDKIQAVSQWGGKEYKAKEIFANLSTQLMGKVNDPDTAKMYEKYFELIKEEKVSISKSVDVFYSKNDTRKSISEQERSKIRGFEFFKLQQGEFIMFADGLDEKFRFFYEPPVEKLPPTVRCITDTEMQDYYEDILQKAACFLPTHFK